MRSSESGNVIFYLFVAVALLAALSFAVAQGSRSSGKSLTEDRARLAASEVISYGDTLNKATGQLRLRGISAESLRFSYPDAHADYGVFDTSPTAEIFNSQGGGIAYRAPPALALENAAAVYEFTGANQVSLIGQDCAGASCSDLLMVLSGVKLEVCQLINYLLGFATKTATPPEESDTDLTRFAGTYTNTETLSDEEAVLTGKSAGCYRDANASAYTYYQVLLAR